MIDALPAAPDPATDLPAVFSQKAAAMVLAQKAMVPQINAVVANLNSIAAGGAYAIPLEWGNLQAAGGSSQSTMTQLLCGFTDSLGRNIQALLDTFDDSTSALKGIIRLYKQNDVSTYMNMYVTGGSAGAFQVINVIVVSASSANPFVNGDSLILDFHRTGDKGDSGLLTPVLWVRDEKGSGQGGGTAASGNQYRTLNTVKKNTIAGATVAGDQINLPVGTYRLYASAPAYNVGAHRVYISIVSNGTTAIEGQTSNSSNGTTQSVIGRAEIVLTNPGVLTVMHLLSSYSTVNGLGVPANLGGTEVYTDVFIEKVT